MSRLKQATQDQHQEVEALMPVMQPSLSLEAYARLLRQLQSVVEPLEAGLLTLTLPAPFGLGLRLKKAPLLVRDLAALPDTPPAAPPPVPLLAGVPEALGALYVLEGGTLGGQVITRHLRRHLGLTPDRGGAYFHGYGPDTGRMWQAFVEAMNRWGAAGEEARVIRGAQMTFQAFGDALRRVPA